MSLKKQRQWSLVPLDDDPESLLELLELLDLLAFSPFFAPSTGDEEAANFSSTATFSNKLISI